MDGGGCGFFPDSFDERESSFFSHVWKETTGCSFSCVRPCRELLVAEGLFGSFTRVPVYDFFRCVICVYFE